MTRIAAPEGEHPYDVTSDDVLWMRRAVQAEGEPRELVAQTLVNGFMLARSRGYSGSLTSFVRAYAQPVNPRWYASGDLHAQSMAKATTQKGRDERTARARSRELVHSIRNEFSDDTLAAVESAFKSAPKFPHATDYAAPDVVRNPPWVPLTAPIRGVNRLWAKPGAMEWQGYIVDTLESTAAHVASVAKGHGGTLLCVLAALAGAAFLLRKGL